MRVGTLRGPRTERGLLWRYPTPQVLSSATTTSRSLGAMSARRSSGRRLWERLGAGDGRVHLVGRAPQPPSCPPHGGARASEPPCSADEPLQVGYRQDALRSIHTEALRPSSSSEESPRAFRQRVPTVKARAPRCGRTTTALGLEFACLRVLATVRQLCASGPYGVLEQNGAYSGGTLHPRCCDLRLQRAAVWTPCRHVTAPLGADDVSRAGRCSLGAHRSRRPVCPHGRAGASAPPCSADEPLQVGYRQDALRSIHTEALRPSSSSEESPRAFRQRVPAVKARAPRCGRTTTAFGLEFACLQVLATVRQLCASGPYGVLEQNGAYSGGTLHPRCYDMRLQ